MRAMGGVANGVAEKLVTSGLTSLISSKHFYCNSD